MMVDNLTERSKSNDCKSTSAHMRPSAQRPHRGESQQGSLTSMNMAKDSSEGISMDRHTTDLQRYLRGRGAIASSALTIDPGTRHGLRTGKYIV